MPVMLCRDLCCEGLLFAQPLLQNVRIAINLTFYRVCNKLNENRIIIGAEIACRDRLIPYSLYIALFFLVIDILILHSRFISGLLMPCNIIIISRILLDMCFFSITIRLI